MLYFAASQQAHSSKLIGISKKISTEIEQAMDVSILTAYSYEL
jgi:hypothetical protein